MRANPLSGTVGRWMNALWEPEQSSTMAEEPLARTEFDVHRPLVIACGALVRELRAALAQHNLAGLVDVEYLPASLHNRPDGITPAVEQLLNKLDPRGERRVLLGYADCGTGGKLDRLLDGYPHVQRLSGAHCYEFFAGSETFKALAEEELGTFFLTDFLARNFRPLVWEGLGLDRHPELLPVLFHDYTRVLLLTQTAAPEVRAAAEWAACKLGLRLEVRETGLDCFSSSVLVALRPAGH